jgi:hypothetical protein
MLHNVSLFFRLLQHFVPKASTSERRREEGFFRGRRKKYPISKIGILLIEQYNFSHISKRTKQIVPNIPNTMVRTKAAPLSLEQRFDKFASKGTSSKV